MALIEFARHSSIPQALVEQVLRVDYQKVDGIIDGVRHVLWRSNHGTIFVQPAEHSRRVVQYDACGNFICVVTPEQLA